MNTIGTFILTFIGKLKNDDQIDELTAKNLAKFKDFGEK